MDKGGKWAASILLMAMASVLLIQSARAFLPGFLPG